MRRTILRNLKPLQVSATPAANSTSQPQTPRPPRTSCRHLQTPRTIRPISTTTSSSTQVPAPSPPAVPNALHPFPQNARDRPTALGPVRHQHARPPGRIPAATSARTPGPTLGRQQSARGRNVGAHQRSLQDAARPAAPCPVPPRAPGHRRRRGRDGAGGGTGVVDGGDGGAGGD